MQRQLLNRRRFALAAAALGASGWRMPAWAEGDYPNRPIRLLVGYSAAGPTDVLARLLGTDMSATLGRPIVVENRPGANGNIATDFVERATPDGYTLIMNTISHNVNPLIQPDKIKYDPVKDFTPICMVAVLPQVIVVAGDSPYKTLDDLLKKARSAPNATSFGSAGIGGSAHLAAALLAQRSKTQMTHIPFKGNAPALTEVMSGRVDFMFYPMIGLSSYVTSGKLRLLATTTAARDPDYPQVPTLAELGFAGFDEYEQPIGFLGPAGLPAPITARIDASVVAALAKPALRGQLKALGADVQHLGSAQYRDWLVKDRARWADLVRSANIKAE